MEKNIEVSLLLDFYGELLKPGVRETIDLYYNDDLSLAEVADQCGITRQGVHDSIRRGEVPGIHTIRYNSQYDEISITHDAHNRGGFALGAVLAAEFTRTHKGLLTMDDMMGT